MIRVVCFDLGGVLVRICRSWDEGCKAAGLEVRGDSTIDPDGADGARAVSHLHQTGKIDRDEFLRQVVRSRHGLYTFDEVRRIHEAWLLGEYPGVGDVVDRLHAVGLSTAALSNTNHAHWERLTTYPTLKRLRHRLASHELGLAKPDIAIYREAEKRLGASASSILFFDDLPENIEGARQAGWDAVLIDHTGDTAAQFMNALHARDILP